MSGLDGPDPLSLPEEFSDFAPAIAWALPDEEQRYRKRMGSSMEELRAFYQLVAPRVKDARAYLDGFDINDMPPDEQHLMWLLFSFIIVSYAVDVFDQPIVPDTGSAYFERVGEPQTYPV